MKKNCEISSISFFLKFRTKLFLKKFWILMMLSLSICAYAQNKHVIKGVVTDSKQEPLIGAAVIVKGNTSQGTVTDVNGQFTLSVSDQNQTLIVSYIGMMQQEVAINSKSQNLKIVLLEDKKQLDEVVVVGYGTSKKSDISGSVVSVNKDEMLKKVPTNIVQGMKGMAAGVVVSAQDGSPDANSSIQIRGVATINGDSKPLYVIDGVVVGKDANFLNPSDVESMEILKDASATAIYGSAGANGVVMITTKHGSVGSAHITFTADYGIQNLAKKLDVGDAD
jgi:TonB-dependent SusC/RagA subfamily outer membrane receptor